VSGPSHQIQQQETESGLDVLGHVAATILSRLTVVLQGIMLIGVAVSAYLQNWLNVFLIAGIVLLSVLPAVLGQRLEIHIPKEFELVTVVFVFASLFLGEIAQFYARLWWWDLLLHGASAMLLGILAFLLVYVLNQQKRIDLHMKPAFVALFSFTFAISIGSLWEVFEFTMDRTLGLNMQKSGLRDTMTDLMVNAGGALIVSLAGYTHMRAGTRSFIEHWTLKFVRANPQLFRRARGNPRS
jgi:hypothetical protein